MPIKLSFVPYIPPIKYLTKITLTPAQRFERITRKLDKSKTILRKYHFNLVEGLNNKTCLFDGEGKEIGSFEKSIEGTRIAREVALNIFLFGENQNGGFQFTSSINNELMSYDEIERAKMQTKKNLEYQPFNLCKNCEFQFEPEDFSIHHCIIGRNWIVFVS